MSLRSKPLWFEGMFVRPQHFQQYDRWIEATLNGRIDQLGGHFWGVRHLVFDAAQLALGKLVLAECTAVMRDGLLVSLPDDVTPPSPRDVGADVQNAIVYLAVPIKSRDGSEVSAPDTAPRRYNSAPQRVHDSTRPERSSVDLHVGDLNVRLLIGTESAEDHTTLPIGRISRLEGGQVTLDDTFVPPVVSVAASERLTAIGRETLALLASRAGAVAGRVEAGQGQGGASGLSDMLTLSLINRAEMNLAQLMSQSHLHPWTLYQSLVDTVGSLSALSIDERRPAAAMPYDHADLGACYENIRSRIIRMLSVIEEEPAIRLPLKITRHGIWVCQIGDRSIFSGHRFVMAVVADMPSETVRRGFPSQTKLGPLERIRDLVNLQLPGIQLVSLPVAPREITYFRDGVYFELDQRSDLWTQLSNSAAFAMHVSGDYPNLRVELWAIRDA